MKKLNDKKYLPGGAFGFPGVGPGLGGCDIFFQFFRSSLALIKNNFYFFFHLILESEWLESEEFRYYIPQFYWEARNSSALEKNRTKFDYKNRIWKILSYWGGIGFILNKYFKISLNFFQIFKELIFSKRQKLRSYGVIFCQILK